jgi:hypothetical protein
MMKGCDDGFFKGWAEDSLYITAVHFKKATKDTQGVNLLACISLLWGPAF